MKMGPPRFTVGPPPHRRAVTSIAQMNYACILALGPAAVVGAVSFGFTGAGNAMPDYVGGRLGILLLELGLGPEVLKIAGALGVLSLAAGLGILVEYLAQLAFRQPLHALNGHGALMGLLLAMLLPPTVPWWVLVVGVTVAIVAGKQIFGGIGAYPFHPALVGWLALTLAWPRHVYPVGAASIAAAHPATIYFTLLGGIMLAALGFIRFRIALGMLLGVAVGGAVFHQVYPETVAGFYPQLTTGSVMLGAFFIATDSTTSPVNPPAMLLFGFLAGATTMLIRVYGVWPDAVPFALLLLNLLHPILDRIRPRPLEAPALNY